MSAAVTTPYTTIVPTPGIRPIRTRSEIVFHAWTVDGTEPTSQEDLFAVDPRTGVVRRVTDDRNHPNGYGISDRDPDWSPQRTRLVHMRSDDRGEPHLSLRQADGTPLRDLPVPGTEPVWMSNRRILCLLPGLDPTGNTDRRDVAAVTLPTAVLTPVTAASPGEFYSAPAWHPTAGLVAVLTREDASRPPRGSALVWVSAATVKTAVSGGPAVTRSDLSWLTGSAHRVSCPAWSPDGTRITFSTARPCATVENGRRLNQGEIAIVTLQPPRVVELVTDDATGDYPDGLDDHDPVFSPDGRWLAWARGHEDGWAVLVIQRVGAPGTRRLLVPDRHWYRGGLDW